MRRKMVGWAPEACHTAAGRRGTDGHSPPRKGSGGSTVEHRTPEPVDRGRPCLLGELAGLARYARDRILAQDNGKALRLLDQTMAGVDYRRRTGARLSGQQERRARE